MAGLITLWLTVCAKAADVLPAKFVSPPYTAVMLCAPTDRDAVLKVATPEASAPVPNCVAPSLKVTVPVGVPPAPLTVAVNVTVCPADDGLAEEASVVVVEFVTTVSVKLCTAFEPTPFLAVKLML